MLGMEKIFKMNTLIENIRVIPDFSKVQILQLIGNPDILVLTTGKTGGDTREIYYFEGVFLTEGNGRIGFGLLFNYSMKNRVFALFYCAGIKINVLLYDIS